MNRQVALAATMRFSRVFPLVAVAALLAACGDEGTDPTNAAPTAAFTVQCGPPDCTFTNSSTDADGTIEGYDWGFGDDSPHVTTRDAVHTYPAPGGRFTVTLTVTDDDGETATATKQVDVSEANVAPTADFTRLLHRPHLHLQRWELRRQRRRLGGGVRLGLRRRRDQHRSEPGAHLSRPGRPLHRSR